MLNVKTAKDDSIVSVESLEQECGPGQLEGRRCREEEKQDDDHGQIRKEESEI